MNEILMPKLGEIEGLSCFRANMAFRDHIADALCVDTPTSCIHGVFQASKNEGHPLMIFNDIIESKGHRVALNLLTRDRLAKSMGIPASEIVDILGREVATLVNENKLPGKYQVRWFGKNNGLKQMSSGVYFVMFKAGPYSSLKKITLLKIKS